jgi:valyl-tRNA synthetase
MSEERIEGYKFFVNKIWNATRFSMMNLEDYEAATPVAPEDLSTADRWILSRLNRTVAEVCTGLDEYRFNDASAAVYQFVWHELCDWYLELSKPVLYGPKDAAGRRAAQQTLLTVLTTSLKLLHPFMPFLTEEIWQTLVADGSSVMVSAFPAADESAFDQDAEQQMVQIMEVITRIRNIRGEMNVAPSLKLRVTLTAPAEALRNSLEKGRVPIVNLANLESLEIAGDMATDPKGAATAVAGPVHIYVFLAGVIDVEGEKGRLNREIAKVEKEMAGVLKKLANPDFLAKAAEAIVKKEQEKARAFGEKKAALEAALARVAAL